MDGTLPGSIAHTNSGKITADPDRQDIVADVSQSAGIGKIAPTGGRIAPTA